MSDKYSFNDCTSYTHCCQNNTYRIERRDIKVRDIPGEDETDQKAMRLSWWQRLVDRKREVAKTD